MPKFEIKEQAIRKNHGGLTLRLKNTRTNESMTDFQKSYGAQTMFEAKTGRLPVVASHKHTELSLLSGARHNDSLLNKFNEKSVIEDVNLENSIDPNDPVVS